IIGARYSWGPSAPTRFAATSRPNGYTGRGVDIAVIDTGIDGGHEDTDNLVEFCDTTGAATGSRNEVACSPQGADNLPLTAIVNPTAPEGPRRYAFDDEGHGSHVSGTVAGSGDASGGMDATHSTIGVAPEARLHVYSANVGPVLLAFQILSAYDDMIAKKQAAIAAGQPGVVATSNSFGGGDGANYSPDDPQNIMHKLAYDVGIISVYAAGNSGPEHNTLSDSCIDPWVVCVGATTKPDSVVQFSSRGRPSEPADTNRNGVVGDDGTNGTPDDTSDDIAADVAPDNHDRKLGQKLGIGLYRPTLAAPGVNINSISANAPGCREGVGTDTGCYEPLNGTSMATPHVSGAIGVIVQAYRAANAVPATWPSTKKHSAIIIDILERSAGLHKLPGYESEEQGAGRLNVWDAVRFIRGEIRLPKPNLGTPSPVYASGKFPGAAATKNSFDGCTGALSFTVGDDPNPLDEGADQPPDADTGRYGAHRIDVPLGAERLRITGEWPAHPGSNLYLRLWRPGVNPNDEFSTDFSERAFPDQEAVGLIDETALLEGRRFLDVRAPEAGEWRLRVYHRAGGAPLPCTTPNPNLPEPFGYNYTITTEIPISARVPTVAFTEPAGGSTHTDRVIVFRGTATYPTRWDGVTNYEVPGTGVVRGGDVEDPRVPLHFQGNTEEGCTGDGSTDMSTASCNDGNGPSLLPKTALSEDPAASFDLLNPILGGNAERHPLIPNWIWDISSETALRGPMTVNWWASCSACGPTLGSA
ncbi:MAG: S8 family serine peptidase, partial [Chloroflexota bacterium]|nr:S8 family serine peptidase [Chloroflexota bacterium]